MQLYVFFFFNDTATTEIYTLSLHDALPILGTYEVTWKARTEASEGRSSPEELIAAAHSACFSMAFSHALAQAGHAPEEVNTKADVTFVPGTGITGSHLTMSARIPGISEDEFQKIAAEAKVGCPVSGARS